MPTSHPEPAIRDLVVCFNVPFGASTKSAVRASTETTTFQLLVVRDNSSHGVAPERLAVDKALTCVRSRQGIQSTLQQKLSSPAACLG